PLPSAPFPYTTLFRSYKSLSLQDHHETEARAIHRVTLLRLLRHSAHKRLDICEANIPILVTEFWEPRLRANIIVLFLDKFSSHLDRKSTRLNSSHVSI